MYTTTSTRLITIETKKYEKYRKFKSSGYLRYVYKTAIELKL